MPTYKPVSMPDLNRDDRILTEKKRLWEFYKKLSGHRRALAEKLIDRASNQLVMVEDLEEYVREHGYTEEYTNGKDQAGKKQSSEMQVYLQLSRQYNQTIKQLDDMLPADPVETKHDELAEFIQKKPVVYR